MQQKNSNEKSFEEMDSYYQLRISIIGEREIILHQTYDTLKEALEAGNKISENINGTIEVLHILYSVVSRKLNNI
ncbi:MAG: hypothetical protein IJX16_04880 [Clostridia bacterium]|nr:hypothetical protein [Clostridia bacterium]